MYNSGYAQTEIAETLVLRRYGENRNDTNSAPTRLQVTIQRMIYFVLTLSLRSITILYIHTSANVLAKRTYTSTQRRHVGIHEYMHSHQFSVHA